MDYFLFHQAAPSKAVDLGLNFTKKSDKPGYTVKKFAEVKTEERTTTSKPAELGLSFTNKVYIYIVYHSLTPGTGCDQFSKPIHNLIFVGGNICSVFMSGCSCQCTFVYFRLEQKVI